MLAAAALVAAVSACASTRPAAEERPTDGRQVSVVDPPADSARAQRMFIRGLTQQQLESYDEALLYFEQALQATPKNPSVLSAMAETYERKGEIGSAIDHLERAVTADSSRRSYYRELASLYERADESARAEATYRTLLDRFGFDEAAVFELARLQADSGRPAEAIGSYQRILDQKGESLRVRYRLLSLYRQTGRRDRMIETLEVLARADADNPEIYRMLTEAYLEDGRLEEAAETLRHRLRRKDARSRVVVELAQVYDRMGRSGRADSLIQSVIDDEDRSPGELADLARSIYLEDPHDASGRSTAERLFERVLARDSSQTDALYFLGRIRFQQERYAEAGDLLRRSVDSNPRRRRAWIQSALAYLRSGRTGRALGVAEEALVLFPGDFNLLRIGGIAAYQTGRSDRAIRYLEGAASPDHVAADSLVRSRVVGTLAMVYDQTGRVEDADSAYGVAVALDSSNATALNNLAYSLAERGEQLDRALELARRAVSLDSDHPSFLDTLGWIYFKLGDLPEAARYVKRAIDTGGASATVHQHYGDIQHGMGNEAAAEEYWQKATEMRPSSDASASQQIDGSPESP